MLFYVVTCLALILTGIAGLQMAYMFYLDRLDRERKKRLRQLERRCKALAYRLEQAERRIEEQDTLLENYYNEPDDDENWADIIEDR
ncbi:MAG: hypothetical protein QUS14_12435 [Pyrinomonadaceae bacterium]|nr:hypothetical protein [Pyrinomonadaceae bacterium]